jgi:DNA-binding NtrC family response regulator
MSLRIRAGKNCLFAYKTRPEVASGWANRRLGERKVAHVKDATAETTLPSLFNVVRLRFHVVRLRRWCWGARARPRSPLLTFIGLSSVAAIIGRPKSSQRVILVGQTVEDVERRLVLETLRHCRGNRARAAAMLGITTSAMREKLRPCWFGAGRSEEWA